MKPYVFGMLVAMSAAALGLSPAAAQPDSMRVGDPSPGESMTGCPDDEECPVLTLDAFLERVRRFNPAVTSIRLTGDRAAATLQGARGAFDPTLVSGYEYKTQNGGDKLNVLRTGLDVPFNLPMSPSLIVDYRRGLGSSIDPSVKTTVDGETSVGLAFEPLSGLFLDKKQASLQNARLEPRRVNAQQAEERNRLLLEATRAYWKWVESVRKVEVTEDLLELATRRRNLVIRQAQTGEAAAIDSTEAKLAVANRRDQLAASEKTAAQARVKLATYLWRPDGRPEAFAFAPPPDFAPDGIDGFDAAAASQAALNRRPELRRLEMKRRQAAIEERLARGQQRPDLKLKAQVVSFENGPTDVSDVKLGFEISQPLFFRDDRSDADLARIERRQVTLKKDQTRRKIRADVEGAFVDLRQSRRQVEAARERVELARRLQEAEQRRFEVGESTLFLVNRREQDLAKARKALVAARAGVARAVAEVRWATGTIADEGRADLGSAN